ncbi:unnamed protein product [Protopolystoma xenopodis]|uniref:Elongation factor EFG domain-containing protein n=1 Tax=Protopolystoma xenopodis TaxID=117903 RepID=A0A448XFJ9_9PLAT|nr:unnamed protein product [Protopolystoma xenopodis]
MYGNWVILEPVMLVEASVPSEFQGTLMSTITKRNGIIVSTESKEAITIVQAEVPLNDMFGYAGELRSQTEGTGEFTMEYYKYCPVRPAVSDLLINQANLSSEKVSNESKKSKKSKS